LNYLQVKDCIFVPWLPIAESRDVQSLFIDLFPDKQIEFIGPCEDIVHAGGALHCVTWNIQVDPAPVTLEEACF
jgi:agmatine/peptidylarginine deiminase